MKNDTTLYRLSAKAIIRNGRKLLLVNEDGKHWDLPGGGVEHGESLASALRRELEEELGCRVNVVDPQLVGCWTAYVPARRQGYCVAICELDPRSTNVTRGLTASNARFMTIADIRKLRLAPFLEPHRQALEDLVGEPPRAEPA